MKTKVVLLILLCCVIGLILSIDSIYNYTIAKQGSSQAKLLKVKNPVVDKATELLNKTPTHLLNGFDWSLPANTSVDNTSGLLAENKANQPMINNQFLIVRWDKTNPQYGVYDFSDFEKQLDSLPHKKALVRLEVNSSCEAPAWALQKLRVTSTKSLIYWDNDYLKLTSPFIQMFAKRYAANPQIIGVQLGLADGEFSGPCEDYDNKDGWGEFWMSPSEREEAESKFSFNPEIFETSSKANIDVYVSAFGKHKNKLAFTNIGTLFTYGKGSEPYNSRLKEIAKYALAQGVGNRDGAIEQWMSYTDKIYGNIFTTMPDGTCRLDFDENYANKIRGRYWGTENEFYGNDAYILDRHGPYENQPYRFLISSLRALQMRRNFMSLSDMRDIDDPLYKTQEFLYYLTKVMGKQIENTPDAFVLLGERYIAAFRLEDHHEADCVKKNGDRIPIRSFGRWIEETSEGIPAIKISMSENENFWDQKYYLPDGIDYEYMARESKHFSFDINDQLAQKRCEKGCEVEIKATFKDTVKTSLNIVVAEGRSQFLETKGDNQIKTATFTIKSSLMNKIKSSDVVLKSEHAIPLILLRVNFL